MNRYVIVLAIALLSTLAASAQEVYRIKIRGKLISPDGVTRIKETDLVRTNGHLLTYVVDVPGREFDLVETFANGTSFTTHIHADDSSVVADGHGVVFDCHESTGFANNLAGLTLFTGRMIAKGRVTEKSIRLSVIGVWDTSTDTYFKGVITGKRVLP